MKNFVLFFLLSFSIEGVFGETVSVIDGDSVTLHTGLTKIQEDDVLEWRFGAGRDRIVRARKDSDPKYDDVLGGKFRDRLKLDRQTGDLTITNIKTEHAGLYEISINAIALRTFTVNVVSGVDEVKSVSVTVGYSVTLNSRTNIQRDDVIEWRFLNSSIAEHNRKTGIFSTSDGPNEIFRHRLQLDYLTGSLTIWNIETKHSGLYEAVIRKSSSGYTIHQSYNVTVTDPGMSAGEIVGIVLGVLLACAVAAAVIYHCHRISELKEWIYKWRIRSVMEGEPVTLNLDVTLNPNDTDVHKDDTLVWMFRSARIAQRNSGAGRFTPLDDASDGRFEGRLKLDPQTGSLTITDTRTTDTGVYELVITRPGMSSIKRFSVSVFAKTSDIESVSVKKGDPVNLPSGVTDIQTVGQILWKLGYTPLAKIKRGKKKISPSAGGMFKGRLKLDHQTGSLIINETRPTDAGIYMLYEIEKGNIQRKLFRVSVSDPTDNRNNPEWLVKKNNPEDVPLRSVEAS